MEIIKQYLENLFSGLPQNDEILHIKAEMLNNMEMKYLELKSSGKTENEAIGTVIAEFGNINELLDEMEISADKTIVETENNDFPILNMSKLDDFVASSKRNALFIALGVGLVFLGIILLIFSQVLMNRDYYAEIGTERFEEKMFRMDFLDLENSERSVVVSIALFFLALIPAVGLFIWSGMDMVKTQYIRNKRFIANTSVQNQFNNKYEKESNRFVIYIILGVSLVFIALIAMILTSFINIFAGGILFFTILAFAVMLFIYAGMTRQAFGIFRYYKIPQKRNMNGNKIIEIVASVFWPVIVAIYLLWSFVTHDWYISWIIFPICGVLFGAFAAFIELTHESK